MKEAILVALALGLVLANSVYADGDPEPMAVESSEVVVEAVAEPVAEVKAEETAVPAPVTEAVVPAPAPETAAPDAETVVPAAVEAAAPAPEAVAVPVVVPAPEAPVAEPVKAEAVPEEKPAEVMVEAVVVEEVKVEVQPASPDTPVPATEEIAVPAPVVKDEPMTEPAPATPATEKVAAPAPVEVAAPAAPVVKKPATAPAQQLANACETDKPACGCNCSRLAWTALMYIPNRFLDLNDSITMNIGAGAEAAAEVSLTKYAQFGASYGSEYYLAKDYNNQYGGAYKEGWSYAIVPPVLDEQRYVDDDEFFGTIKPYIIRKDGLHIESRDAEVYKKNIRDFWAIRVSAGWFVTAEFELHPIDMADFVLGFFFVDFKGNDIK